MGPQPQLESNPVVVRERRERTWENMQRQLSFVMCTSSAANASELVACCRKHRRSAAEVGRRWKSRLTLLALAERRSPQEERWHASRITNARCPRVRMVIINIVCWVAWRPLSSFIFRLMATVSLLLHHCSWRVSQYLLSCQLVIDLPQLTGTVTGGQ